MTRTFTLSIIILTGSCVSSTDSGQDEAGAHEDLIEECEQICLKPLCDGAIDPTYDVQAVCRMSCEEEVDMVVRNACDEPYAALHQCLEPLACDAFFQWLEQHADMPCQIEEQSLSDACPELDIRSTGS